MKKLLQRKLGYLGLTALVGWLMWAAPVSWAACTAMSLYMLTPACEQGGDCSKPIQNMQEGCLLQLGGFSNYLATPSATLHLPPPVALPAAPLESLLRRPQVSSLVPFVDISPPLRPRPLYVYYSVFLK